MNYYFLPGAGIFGGIKMGYQLVDSLNSLGVAACVASPNGVAAQWFNSTASVVDQDEVLANWRSEDVAIFSLPHDYSKLRPICERLVFHCQGTDPLIDDFISDSKMIKIACWQQAQSYFHERDLPSFLIPLAIPKIFFYSGEPKLKNSLAYMSRRGKGFLKELIAGQKGWRLHEIDDEPEAKVAAIMKESEYFIAASPGEWFGLPALEAMAAGCVVLSPKVIGGTEFLLHKQTALVGELDDLRSFLGSDRLETGAEIELSQRGMALAYKYSTERHLSAVKFAISQGVFG